MAENPDIPQDAMPKPRPTMQELFERATMQDNGRVCRHCGCQDFRVMSTWHNNDGTIRRKRVCRHCGQDGYNSAEKPDEKKSE